ncbi:MAG: hypothetical protein KGH89_05725 [Thaumarchaeota archaeon]|nr:hypothetical protein [Nitrososphaerota archaeon]
MTQEKIKSFRTITELQQMLDSNIGQLKNRSGELSGLIGEKLRATDSTNSAELQDMRQKIEGVTNDPKKKKSVKKKDQKNNWYNLDSISIFDGIGLKGELELYFKAAEQVKSELDRATKIKQAVDDLVARGLKKDLGCVFLTTHELPAEIAFTQTAQSRAKFSFKSIFDVPIDEINII